MLELLPLTCESAEAFRATGNWVSVLGVCGRERVLAGEAGLAGEDGRLGGPLFTAGL